MFETFSAVLLLVIFLVPGFVWRTVEGQLVYLDKGLEWERFALGLLTRSTFVYLPFAPLFYRGYKNDWLEHYPVSTALAAVGFIIVLPSVFGLAAGTLRQKSVGRKVFQKLRLGTFEQHHIPTAWDFIFSNVRPAWVVVTLKNGSKLYGYLSPTSYISSDSKERDIFISHVLRPNSAGDLEFVHRTEGAYIAPGEVSTIEFTKKE